MLVRLRGRLWVLNRARHATLQLQAHFVRTTRAQLMPVLQALAGRPSALRVCHVSGRVSSVSLSDHFCSAIFWTGEVFF